MRLWVCIVIAATLVFTGCSSKKHFEPEKTFNASKSTSHYSGKIISVSRDGATLEDHRYISQSEGMSSLDLGEGYRFLSESDRYVLASNIEGALKVIEKSTQKVAHQVNFDSPVLTAAIKGRHIAYILNNNTFGLYDIQMQKKMIEERSDETYAIDARVATPLYVDQLVVYPMLDGKLMIMNTQDVSRAGVVYLSSAKVFNNVIYLARAGNTVVAATPKTIITLGEAGEQEYQANISDVAVADGMVYLFTKEGEIIKLNKALKELKRTKFKFAHYSVATVTGGKVYALDQKGSLIVLDDTLTKSRIYDVGEVKQPACIAQTKLYKDGDVIELSKLGYE